MWVPDASSSYSWCTDEGPCLTRQEKKFSGFPSQLGRSHAMYVERTSVQLESGGFQLFFAVAYRRLQNSRGCHLPARHAARLLRLLNAPPNPPSSPAALCPHILQPPSCFARSPTKVALCAIAQLFIVVTHPPLVRLLVLETLGSGGSARGVGSGARSSSPAAAATTTSTTEVVLSEERGGVRGGPGMGSAAPLLALLQGDREELCLGALVVLQVCCVLAGATDVSGSSWCAVGRHESSTCPLVVCGSLPVCRRWKCARTGASFGRRIPCSSSRHDRRRTLVRFLLPRCPCLKQKVMYQRRGRVLNCFKGCLVPFRVILVPHNSKFTLKGKGFFTA